MDKEILYLSDPRHELKRVDKAGDRRDFFKPAPDFGHGYGSLLQPGVPVADIGDDGSLDWNGDGVPDWLYAPEWERFGGADTVHDSEKGYFFRPGNRLSLLGFLIVNHKGAGCAEYPIISSRQTLLIMKKEELGLNRNLSFQLKREEKYPSLSPADGRSTLIYEKQSVSSIRLTRGLFFCALLPDGTVLEMTFREFESGNDSYRYYSFPDRKDRITIGRTNASDIHCFCRCFDRNGRYTGDIVSRKAGVIRRVAGKAVLEDLSSHGIYVNHQPVKEPRVLKDGDVIHFWNCRMIWHEDGIEIRNSGNIKVNF